MKKQIDLQLMAILIGGLLFNYLFWTERLALNLLLYSAFVLIITWFNKDMSKGREFYYYAFANLLAGLLVVYNNSDLTVIAYYFSLMAFVGFAHGPLIRSIFTALLAALLQIVSSPVNLIKHLMQVKIGNFSFKPLAKKLKYIMLPFMVIIVFSIIYSIANPIFDSYLSLVLSQIENIFSAVFTFIFGDLSLARVLHVVLGALLTAGILIGYKVNNMEHAEAMLSETLIRRRRTKSSPTFETEFKNIFAGGSLAKKMALKTENIVGVICFAALNLLLLFLNTIDVNTLWLGNLARKAAVINYSAALHEGTNALIFSILMAMLVILYFFSGNLNFFSKNKTLRVLANIWIIQNAFLVLSVLLRDYNYISMHGLTYKRIGVIVFLTLCAVGLFTVYLKVAKQKSFFYLYKINGLVWYVLLLLSGLVNWDVFIVNYNLQNRKTIALDLEHLINMSDKTLPLLDQHRKVLATYLPLANREYVSPVSMDERAAPISAEPAATGKSVDSPTVTAARVVANDNYAIAEKKEQQMWIDEFNYNLDQRISSFNHRYKNTSWLSFNYRDWQTMRYFGAKK